MKDYRYSLPQKKKKHPCPNCGEPRCFVRYIDTRTGELLPDAYGRCDREAKCGYHANPYDIEADGLSYKERVYRQGKEAAKSAPSRTRRPLLAPVAALPPVLIPESIFTASLSRYSSNQFARLLRARLGVGVANELLTRFEVGTLAHWPGACVFWFTDEHGGRRAGQVKLFDETFHTVKGKTTWVHTALKASYGRKQQPCPDWLVAYEQQPAKVSCLFGLPQLRLDPPDKPIAIVEAPKTAILCAHYFPDFIWLATGSLSYLNAERLAPLRGRKIELYPDGSADGKTFEKWQAKANEFANSGFRISVSDVLEREASASQKAAGADLADLLLADWPGYPPSWDWDTPPSGTDPEDAVLALF